MAPEVSFRAAEADDYDAALALYLESTRRLLEAMNRWDEERVLSRFALGWQAPDIRILRADGRDIGWQQISESPSELHIDQIHLVEAYRNRGIGTSIIRGLQERARRTRRAVALNVIRGNRAVALYLRLGFAIADEDDEKIRMVWHPVGQPR